MKTFCLDPNYNTFLCVPLQIGKAVLLRIGFKNTLLRQDLSRYVFVKKCAIRIDKKQKERYGKKYCHHSPSIEESLLQDAVMRAIMQTAKQNVEVLKTLKIHIGMGLTDEVTEDKTLDIQIRIAEINTEFQKLLKAVSADNADGIDEERITELMNEKQRLTVQLEQYAAMRQKKKVQNPDSMRFIPYLTDCKTTRWNITISSSVRSSNA